MKKCAVIMLSLVFIAALSITAFAQQYQGGPGPGPLMQDDQDLTPEQFKERKARILQMLDERDRRIAQDKACVEAATNMEELRKCHPRQMRRMGPGGGMRGGPGMPPMDGQQDEQ